MPALCRKKLLYNFNTQVFYASFFRHTSPGGYPMAKNNKLDLEKTLVELESTIHKLEDEQATLKESLDAFEQGIKLTRQAQQTLVEAEQKVKMLLEADGDPDSRDFSELDAK